MFNTAQMENNREESASYDSLLYVSAPELT